MEGGQIIAPLEYVVAIVAGLVTALVAMAAALVYVYKRGETKSKVSIELTKAFVESTKDHAKALENNTRVIEKLPDTIMLHIKAAQKT